MFHNEKRNDSLVVTLMLVASVVKMFHDVKRIAIRMLNLQLYERIKAARERAGISVNGAAEKLGVKRTQIWRMEHKADTVSARRLFELADLYQTDPRELLMGVDATNPPRQLYETLGNVVVMVEEVVQSLDVRPPPDLIRDAIIEVLQQQDQKAPNQSADNFDPAQYRGLVTLIFKQQKIQP